MTKLFHRSVKNCTNLICSCFNGLKWMGFHARYAISMSVHSLRSCFFFLSIIVQACVWPPGSSQACLSKRRTQTNRDQRQLEDKSKAKIPISLFLLSTSTFTYYIYSQFWKEGQTGEVEIGGLGLDLYRLLWEIPRISNRWWSFKDIWLLYVSEVALTHRLCTQSSHFLATGSFLSFYKKIVTLNPHHNSNGVPL